MTGWAAACSSALAAVTLVFLALPIVGIFVHTTPGSLIRPALEPRRPRRVRRDAEDERHCAGADPALRDADGVSPRDEAVPRTLARGHARRAAARPAAGRGGDRAARRARPLGLLGSSLDSSASRSRSRRPRSPSRSRTSRARSTSGRRSPRSRRSIRDCRRRRARSAPGTTRTFFRVMLPLARGGLIAGTRAVVRARPRRVRRDDHVRRKPPSASRRRCRSRSTPSSKAEASTRPSRWAACSSSSAPSCS